MNNIAVVYLSYVPFGTDFLRNFLNSYKKYKAGISHNLIIVFNGYHNEMEIEPFLEILNEASIEFQIEKTTSKYDIDVYYFLTNKLHNFEYFLYLNTYSSILNGNWLTHYYKILNQDGVGCVSATGVWGDFKHILDYEKALNRLLKFRATFNDVKKIIYFRYNFYPTVGVHLRTNAFMIKRDIFLSIQRPKVKPLLIAYLFGLNRKKIRSFCFEHGNNSFSKQLIYKGYKIKIVNKYGLGLNVEQWADSNVYWNGTQENLLIEDNQTMKYQNSSTEVRKTLTFIAWGI